MAQDEKNEQAGPTKAQLPPLSVGTVLEGRYRLTRKLGEGGIGVVFEAEHIRLGRPVAIKVMHEEFAAFELMRNRFDREAKALAALSHPNIVALTDYGVFNGMPYLVMELLQGQTLRELLNVQGRLGEDQALAITAQVLAGLAYAHRSGLVHRDLKPGNIFLERDETGQEQAKILDFGFVKFFEEEDRKQPKTPKQAESLTKSGMAFGTLGYMPPEQLSGGKIGPYSDVYAVGILLYEMLTGSKPFQGEPEEVARHHLVTPVPALSYYCPELTPTAEFQEVLLRALAKKGTDRFADGEAFLEALEGLPRPILLAELAAANKVLASNPPPESSLPSWAQASPTRRSRYAWGVFLALLAGLALLLVATNGGQTLRSGSPASLALKTQQNRQASPEDEQTTPAKGPADSGPDAALELRQAQASWELVSPAEDLAPTDGGTPSTSAPPAVANDAAVQAETSPEPAETSTKRAGVPNPWRLGPAPRLLANARRRVLQDRALSDSQIRAIREYARENRGDARPFLVLAQSFANSGASAAAVERYQLAVKLDPGSRGDPRMLQDLINLLESSSAGGRAALLIVNTYGAEATESVEQALLRRDLSRRAHQRLEWVRQEIRRSKNR